jgi:hypothetical protein
MPQWGYAIVQTQGGQAQTPNGAVSVLQMLNLVGQRGGELVTVVPAGSGLLEWVFKFAGQPPQQLFG